MGLYMAAAEIQFKGWGKLTHVFRGIEADNQQDAHGKAIALAMAFIVKPTGQIDSLRATSAKIISMTENGGQELLHAVE